MTSRAPVAKVIARMAAMASYAKQCRKAWTSSDNPNPKCAKDDFNYYLLLCLYSPTHSISSGFAFVYTHSSTTVHFYPRGIILHNARYKQFIPDTPYRYIPSGGQTFIHPTGIFLMGDKTSWDTANNTFFNQSINPMLFEFCLHEVLRNFRENIEL